MIKKDWHTTKKETLHIDTKSISVDTELQLHTLNFVLTLTRNKYQINSWYATCFGVFNHLSLVAFIKEDAQQEAEHLLKEALHINLKDLDTVRT